MVMVVGAISRWWSWMEAMVSMVVSETVVMTEEFRGVCIFDVWITSEFWLKVIVIRIKSMMSCVHWLSELIMLTFI